MTRAIAFAGARPPLNMEIDLTTAKDIVEALIAASSDFIWAQELDFFRGKRRIDFWTLAPIPSKGFQATAYEIKISRADYKRDCDEKQSGALLYSDRFYYVTPPGLLAVSELPSWAGLMEWDGERMKTIRRAPARQKQEPSWEFIVSLMRNCGQSRRDTGLLKAQLAFYQAQDESRRRLDRMASNLRLQEWLTAQEEPHLIQTGT
jgi:hypothetical protein